MKIPCSNCNQRLDIPEEYAGQTIECPACKVSLSVPTMVRTESATPSVEVPKFDNKKKNKKRIVSNSSSSSDKPEMSIPKWAIVLGIFSLVMILILLFSSTLANVILQFVCAAVSIICFIGTVKSMFDLGKSGIAWGSIVLFFCGGLGALIAYIWSWTQEDERPTTLIWTFAIAGSTLARGILGPAFGSN